MLGPIAALIGTKIKDHGVITNITVRVNPNPNPHYIITIHITQPDGTITTHDDIDGWSHLQPENL